MQNVQKDKHETMQQLQNKFNENLEKYKIDETKLNNLLKQKENEIENIKSYYDDLNISYRDLSEKYSILTNNFNQQQQILQEKDKEIQNIKQSYNNMLNEMKKMENSNFTDQNKLNEMQEKYNKQIQKNKLKEDKFLHDINVLINEKNQIQNSFQHFMKEYEKIEKISVDQKITNKQLLEYINDIKNTSQYIKNPKIISEFDEINEDLNNSYKKSTKKSGNVEEKKVEKEGLFSKIKSTAKKLVEYVKQEDEIKIDQTIQKQVITQYQNNLVSRIEQQTQKKINFNDPTHINLNDFNFDQNNYLKNETTEYMNNLKTKKKHIDLNE